MRFKPLVAYSALFLLLAAFHLWSLRSFPKLILDEAVESNHAFNLLTQGENVYSLFDDVFPPAFSALKQSFPNTLRPLYNIGLALTFAVAGVGPWTARSFSLLCSFGSMILASWLAWRWTRSHAAGLCAAVLLGVHFLFSLSAHQARPEAMLGLCAAAVFSCLDMGWLIPAGMLAAAAGGVHTNGAGVGLAAAAVLAVRRPKGWPLFLLGGLIGAIPVLYWIHPERFIPGWIVFEGFFSYRPPIRSWGLNIAGAFAAEMTRYLTPQFLGYEPATPGLLWSMRLEWSILWGLWLSGWALFRDKEMRSLLAWIGVWESFYILYVSNKNPYYSSAQEPFYALLFIVFIHRAVRLFPSRPPLWKSLAAGAVLCQGGVFLAVPAICALFLDRQRRALHVLLSLLPVFFFRIFMPDAFFALIGSVPRAQYAAAVLALACAAFWVSRSKAPAGGVLASGLAASLAVNAFAGAGQIASRVRHEAPFDLIIREVRRQVPRGVRVLGPQQLWFAFLDQPYRDWDAAAYGKWLTGDGDVTRHLSIWRPEILITDCRFKDTFLKKRRLGQVITVPMRKIGEVDSGSSYCDPFEIYRIQWPR